MQLYGTAKVNGEGHLEIGGCDTVDLVQQFGTPLYVMDEGLMRANCLAYREALAKHPAGGTAVYAGKAFLTMAMARLVEDEGLGLDVVSGGELYTALKAEFPPERIYFHGNNKSPDEVALALEAGVGRFVADSIYDLRLISQLAVERGVQAGVLLRVTPGIEAHTHEYIRTGQIDSKFGEAIENGMALRAIETLAGLPNLHLRGLHCHIGSQIFELEPFVLTAQVTMRFAREINDRYGLEIGEFSLGGGLGVRYVPGDDPPTIGDLVGQVSSALVQAAADNGLPIPALLLEPGRSIVGEAGTTLYTIGSIKPVPGIRTYLAVDGGMSDNPRPALYGALYQAVVANKLALPPTTRVTVAGKSCESGDILIRDVELALPEPGDILAVLTTGAYNYSMASNYNRLARPAVVFVHDGVADLVVARESYEDLVRNDRLPERLQVRKTPQLA